MKRFSSFSLAEVDVGFYHDQIGFHVSSIVEGQVYPLSILYASAPATAGARRISVEFGDQNWGTHHGIIQSISASLTAFVIRFNGTEGPVPWLETRVQYDWSRINEGKELIINTLQWLCARDGISYNEDPA